jgi:hypothetical protein
MKVTKKQIQEMVRSALKSHLTEAVEGDDSDKELLSFLSKADKILADARESLGKLAEEGEELARKDLSKKDRNASVLLVVGIAKKVHASLVSVIEHMKKNLG